MTKTLEERFFEKTKWNGDCLEWQAAHHEKGYGSFCVGKSRMRAAHKVAWQIAYGYWPTYLLHTCDNPPCVNVLHLKEGTHVDNMADRKAKGRYKDMKGGKQPHSPETIALVREGLKAGKQQRTIATECNVSQWFVCKINKLDKKS
jgi:hypothetical protein